MSAHADPMIEVTDGGCYLTVDGKTLDLSLNYPELDDDEKVRANLEAVRAHLAELAAAIPTALAEVDQMLEEYPER